MARTGGGKKRALLLATAVLAAGTLSCDDSPTAPVLTYPTTYVPLSAQELANRTAQFERENPDNCTALDAYGFTRGLSSGCSYRGTVTCSNADQLIEESKADLVRNQRFTGVLHREEMRLWRYSCDPPGYYSQSIHIRFENQIYDSLEVLGTKMLVHMGDNGVWSIVGHHYPVIFVPTPEVSSQTAEESLVGTKITWSYPTTGEYVIEADSFVGEPYRVILPIQLENRIELRVSWVVNVSNTWDVYMDTITGERIKVENLFVY